MHRAARRVFTPSNGQGNQLDGSGNYLLRFFPGRVVFGVLSFDLAGNPDDGLRGLRDQHRRRRTTRMVLPSVPPTENGIRRFAETGTCRYVYQDLGGNAVVGAFTDSDFAGGTSDGGGHISEGRILDSRAAWGLALRYIIAERGEAAGNPQ